MPEILDSFADEQAKIEHCLLWSDVTEILAKYAGQLGIQIALDKHVRDKVVLQSQPIDGTLVQLWGLPTSNELIGQVTISVQDAGTKVEAYAYELSPASLVYYSRDGKRTRFVYDEIAELRADLQEESWDLPASVDAAAHDHFFDI